MQTLALKNYGTSKLNFDEMQVTDGGGQPIKVYCTSKNISLVFETAYF